MGIPGIFRIFWVFGRTLKENFSKSDQIILYAPCSDEFTVSCKGLIVINDIKIPVTLTMGVAQVDQNEHWQSTLGRADMALYTGKKNGRNQVVS